MQSCLFLALWPGALHVRDRSRHAADPGFRAGHGVNRAGHADGRVGEIRRGRGARVVILIEPGKVTQRRARGKERVEPVFWHAYGPGPDKDIIIRGRREPRGCRRRVSRNDRIVCGRGRGRRRQTRHGRIASLRQLFAVRHSVPVGVGVQVIRAKVDLKKVGEPVAVRVRRGSGQLHRVSLALANVDSSAHRSYGDLTCCFGLNSRLRLPGMGFRYEVKFTLLFPGTILNSTNA